MRFDLLGLNHHLARLQFVLRQHSPRRTPNAFGIARKLRRRRCLDSGQLDQRRQALQQQLHLMFVQPFVALAPKVMANVMVQLLAQQPVLLLQLLLRNFQTAVLRLHSQQARAQLFELLPERRGVHWEYGRKVKILCSNKAKLFLKLFS